MPAESGFILLITGPSGAGKSSVLRPVVDADPRLRFSVSCTTRKARGGERDGQDYHFLERSEFEGQRDSGAFVEWAEVHDYLYGTRESDIDAMLKAGNIAVLDIDIQGGLNILRHYDKRVASVFILPPSWEQLEQRLRGRKTESEEALQTRLRNARQEVEGAKHYDYWLENDDLGRAQGALKSIVTAESLRRGRVQGFLADSSPDLPST